MNISAESKIHKKEFSITRLNPREIKIVCGGVDYFYLFAGVMNVILGACLVGLGYRYRVCGEKDEEKDKRNAEASKVINSLDGVPAARFSELPLRTFTAETTSWLAVAFPKPPH